VQSFRSRSRLRSMRILSVYLLAAACALAAGCSKSSGAGPQKDGKGGGPKGPVAFPVDVGAIESREVEYTVTAVGSVDAFEQVQITARVAGAVEHVRFSEGDKVKKGAILVEIEPQRFQLAARSARATMDRAQAAANDAQRALQRREKLAAEGLSSAEDVDGLRGKMEVTAAELAQAQASLALTQLNLRDAIVRAPVDGVIQTRSARSGQYVQAGTVLATLIQRDPLLLRLSVPEHESSGLKVGMPARFTVRGVEGDLGAELTHVADAADPATRMVQVIAKVTNPPDSLRPGAFAEVVVPIGGVAAAPVVPETAVRPSERGFLAFVVEDGKAKERVLKLGLRTKEGLVEVRAGVKAGETLVIRGAEALRDGSPVRVRSGGDSDAGAAPAAAPSGSASAPAGGATPP